jgi:hypothetical protein
MLVRTAAAAPQSTATVSFVEKLKRRGVEVERQFSFLRRLFTPRTVFMHFGAHDCALALEAASYVERVYAIDAIEGIARGVRLPCNLRFVDSRDLRAIGEGSVDVSFSDRLPVTRLRDIHRSLAPQGKYVFQLGKMQRQVREQLLDAGFSGVKSNFFANLLHNPSLLTAAK